MHFIKQFASLLFLVFVLFFTEEITYVYIVKLISTYFF